MKISQTMKNILMFSIITLVAAFLIGCGGASAGGSGGSSSGSYDITYEVTGSYVPATGSNAGTINNYSLLVTYNYTENGNVIQDQLYDPSLPFSETKSLSEGTGVTLQATLIDTGSVTYSIIQNGTVVESDVSTDTSLGNFLQHSVGQ